MNKCLVFSLSYFSLLLRNFWCFCLSASDLLLLVAVFERSAKTYLIFYISGWYLFHVSHLAYICSQMLMLHMCCNTKAGILLCIFEYFLHWLGFWVQKCPKIHLLIFQAVKSPEIGHWCWRVTQKLCILSKIVVITKSPMKQFLLCNLPNSV